MNETIVKYMKTLENQARLRGETYRARAFKRAKEKIETLNFEINNTKQIKGLPGIGAGVLERVDEILETGALKEVDILDEKEQVLETFLKIHGVGMKTAERWYANGYRTLKDILKRAKLTKAQEIGIKYYDELNQKIPRKLIDEINDIFQDVVAEVNKEKKLNLQCVIAGSYRRKLKECGDIDCLVTDTNNKLTDSVIHLFLNKLKEKKLLTDDFGLGENKYLGVGIDSKGIHRRIDFEFVKEYKNFTYELLYFTGGYQLNVAMRQKAKEKGMLLNQRGLYKNGKLIPAKSEKEIFEKLGMVYLTPEER